ncbi:CynX/NimT family MFS transporter [Chloroflexota bacterium]
MLNTDSATSKNRWVILGVIYCCALAFAFTFQSIPPILSLVMAELDLSHTEGGLLMSFFALPGIVIAIPAGMLADRYNQKVLVIVAMVLMTAGTVIVASSNSLPVLALGRIISGIGAMSIAVILPQLLAEWFAGHEIGTAMGIIHTGMPVGTVLSLSLLSIMGENLGWRTGIWLTAGLSLVALIIFACLYAAAPIRSQRIIRPPEGLFRGIWQIGIPVWMAGFAWMMLNAGHISFVTFTPDFLRTTGSSIASAGFLTSLTMWPALVVSPLIGFVIDKIDRKRIIIAGFGFVLAGLVVWTPQAINWIAVFILLTGIAATIIPPPIFAIVAEVTSPERLGLGYGIVSTCLNIGLLIGPAAAGFAKDVTGSYQASYALMSVFIVMIIPVIFFSRRRK